MICMMEVKSLFYINIFTGCVRQFPVMLMFLLLICAEVNLSTFFVQMDVLCSLLYKLNAWGKVPFGEKDLSNV